MADTQPQEGEEYEGGWQPEVRGGLSGREALSHLEKAPVC